MGKWVMQMLGLLPYIIHGIEHIHGDAKSGAEKKQLAMEAIGLSANVAAGVEPTQIPVIEAATALASNTIDGIVSVMNAAKTAEAPVPAPGAAS